MDEYVYDSAPAVVGVGATEGLTDYGRIAMDMNSVVSDLDALAMGRNNVPSPHATSYFLQTDFCASTNIKI
jgi:hypothetical protein